jgi:hypothetical protein
VFEKVAEFQSMESGRRFFVTGSEDNNGKFVLDEEIEGFFGPFTIFESDGTAAKFIGLKDVMEARVHG